jgi:hypothetical protein
MFGNRPTLFFTAHTQNSIEAYLGKGNSRFSSNAETAEIAEAF